MKLKIMMILLLLIFSGCSQKEFVIKTKVVCIEQEKIDKIKDIKLRIHKDDLEKFNKKNKLVKDKVEFYETQIDNTNNICKTLKKVK